MSTGSRITSFSASRAVLGNLQSNLGNLQRLQEQLSSGKAVQRPSDSPGDALSAMQHRQEIRRNGQYSRNADDGIGWLATADNALTGTISIVGRARDLVLQGANAAMGPGDRNAIAQEILALRDGMVQIANSRYLDRPIFAGTSGNTQAFVETSPGVVVYQGDAGAVTRTVGPGTTIQVNASGTGVFGPDGANVFDTLTQIAAHLQSGNTNALAGADLTALDGHRLRIQDTLSTIGARYNRVETMKSRAALANDMASNSLSDVEDVDIPKTIMELQLQQTAYQAALSASAKVLQPSLIDFLR